MPPKGLAKFLIVLFGLFLAWTLPPANAAAASDLGELQADLSHQLALAGPHDGAYVYDLTTGQPLFSERATTLRPPASVEKLYTATAALARLGPSGRLATTVFGVGRLGPAPRARASPRSWRSSCACRASGR